MAQKERTEERTAVAVTLWYLDHSGEWGCFIQPVNVVDQFAKELAKSKANDVLSYVRLAATSPHDRPGSFYIKGNENDFFGWEIGGRVILALHRWMRDKGYSLDPYFFPVSVRGASPINLAAKEAASQAQVGTEGEDLG